MNNKGKSKKMASGSWKVETIIDKQLIKRRRVNEGSSSSAETLEVNSIGTSTNQLSDLNQLVEVLSTLNSNINNMSGAGSKLNAGNEVIPSFYPDDAKQNIERWLAKVEELKLIYGWTEIATIYYATTKLRGLANVWYQSLPTLNFTWTEWKDKLKSAFPTQSDYAQLLEEMLKRNKRSNESMMQYYYDKLALLNLCEISDRKAVSCIISGITEANIQAAAKVGDYAYPDELLKFLKTVNVDGTGQKFTYKARKPLHVQSNYKNNRDQQEKQLINQRKCYGCGSREHILPVCPNRAPKCSKCGGYHTGECTRKPTRNNFRQVMKVDDEQENNKGNKYFVDAIINDVEVRAYVDLGSNCNTIKEQLLVKLNIMHDGVIKFIKGFGGGTIAALGCIRNIRVRVDQAEANTDFVVVQNEVQEIPVIIGQSFTEQSHIVIYKNSKNLRIYENHLSELPNDVVELPPIKIPIWVKEAVVIPPRHVTNIICHADQKGECYLDSSVRLKECNEYILPRCIINFDENGDCTIPVVNPSNYDVLIKPKRIFARGKKCKQDKEMLCITNMNSQPVGKLDNLNIGQDLTTEQRAELIKLLKRYENNFATTVGEIGCTSAAELKIVMNDETPVMYRPYRMSPADRQKVKEIVHELLQCDIVRESNSPFASPVLLVKKKNGEQRLCIDYRKLNSKIRQERFPLPRIDDQLDQLHGYRYFTTLDMTSGYYQIPVEEQSKNKTSFVTCDGQFEFNRMPFGITTAPSVFQRMINKVLGPLRGTVALAYLDDILIPSIEIDEGMKRLELILDILSNHQLTLNPKKCFFFQTSITYLGFEVNYDGIKPGLGKTKSIIEFPAPTNVHQVRQFLGLTGFFRQFIKDYAILTQPLTRLTKKNVSWHWSEKEQKTFQTLKNLLSERPLLAVYNSKAETEVHTDASKMGLAGILLQKNDKNQLQPVAYFSRQTTPAEKNYHSYELETLAVVESLKKFRVYLLDINFKVVTDCNAIKTAATKRDLISRIARWWLLLQEFTFQIEYRPGIKMAHIDALSRNPVENNSAIEETTIFKIEVADWVLASQLTDDKIKLIIEILKKKPETNYEKDIHKDYCIEDNRIYRKTNSGKKWVLPKGMRNEIVRASHDEFGHFSVEKTLNKICENYWFPKMRQYVKKYIDSCIPCIFNKKPKGKQQGFLHPIEKNATPFHTIHIDHLGPFVKSTTGKRYLIVVVESFTKYTIIHAVKDTKTQPVIRLLGEVVNTFGMPNRIITDKGTCYTSRAFQKYCEQHGIKHVQTAVATPRANGQVERFNSTILSSLSTTAKDDIHWDRELSKIQFAINNSVHSITKKTPSELLLGYRPRAPIDSQLTAEIAKQQTTDDVNVLRENVSKKISDNQQKQKERYDRKRLPARQYQEGDLVVVQKNTFAGGQSKKLLPKYKGPFKIKRILPNDRFVISELPGSYRSKRKPFENIEAIDHLKPWIPSGGKSDSEDEDYFDEHNE